MATITTHGSDSDLKAHPVTDVDDLLAWLRACLDDEERAVQGTTSLGKREGEHIRYWMPSRILAHINATRVILDKVIPVIESMEIQIDGEWGVPDSYRPEWVPPA